MSKAKQRIIRANGVDVETVKSLVEIETKNSNGKVFNLMLVSYDDDDDGRYLYHTGEGAPRKCGKRK